MNRSNDGEMQRYRVRSTNLFALAAGVLLAATMAACGGGDAGDDSTAGAEQAQPAAGSSSGTNDPCALVTAAEAEQVLAGRPDAERPSELNNDYVAACRYVAPRGESVVVLAVKVSRQSGRVGFENAKRMEELGIQIQPVSGVGDEAFWVEDQLQPRFGTLYVLRDTTYLDIGGDVQLEQVRPLALRALERLR